MFKKNSLYKWLAAGSLFCLIACSEPAYLNTELSFEERAHDLVSRMTLAEKVSQMESNAPAIERLGVEAFCWDNEGKHAFVSAFPASIGIAATWDTVYAYRVAGAIADEARATNNRNIRMKERQRYLSFWAPTINIARDPRWGRTNESYGEDPCLTSRMGVSFIRGMQGDDPKYLKVVAGVNHFAVYNEERDRHSVDVTLHDERLLREYFLPHFQACVQEGKAAGVGATNNGFNDIPVCANHFLLTNILREEWGFEGYVFSDAGSVDDLYTTRRYVEDGPTGVSLCVDGGCDLSCSQAYPTHLKEAVEKGLLSEARIDTACYRLFLTRFRLGMFDAPEKVPFTRIEESEIDCPAHRELALEVAKDGIVLLKNKGNILPLDVSKLKKIVVAGPRADAPELGRKQTGNSSKSISPYEGLSNRLKGTSVQVRYEKERIPLLKEAQTADVVVYFTSLKEGEVCDRMNLDLPSHQEKELNDLIATGRPVIVCLINGGCVTMENWEPHVPAILSAWYPGEEGGTALASILFGDCNPSGKLPLTFYKSEKLLSDFEDFNIKKGMTYWYAKENIQYPFGFGLSYTRFTYTDLKVEKTNTAAALYTVSFSLKNTGDREGKEVAQLYIRDVERSTGDQPLKTLKHFQKVSLKPGEEKRISFPVSESDLAFYNEQMAWGLEAGDMEVCVGSSCEEILLRETIRIDQDQILKEGASWQGTDAQVSKTNVMPGEPFHLTVKVTNKGQVSSRPSIFVDGGKVVHPTLYVGPGKTAVADFELYLYMPGEHPVKGDGWETKVEVGKAAGQIRYEELTVSEAAGVGEEVVFSAKVKNAGGENLSETVAFNVNGLPVGEQSLQLEPGKEAQLFLKHSFATSGIYKVGIGGSLEKTVYVGENVKAPFNVFSSARTSAFAQAGTGNFILHASGAVGGCPVNAAHYAGVVEDEYSTVYLKQKMTGQSYAMVKIQQRDLTSNYTKTGLMIKNDITQPGKSAGYLIMCVNGYFNGGGLIEFDGNDDGYLDQFKTYNSGKWPKTIVVEKNGKTFSFYALKGDGTGWVKAHSIEMESAAGIQDVGIFHVSDYKTKASQAIFSDFEVHEGLFDASGIEENKTVEAKREQPL